MKNKVLFYAFRITVILAFITGAVYSAMFIDLITRIGMLYTETAFDSLTRWSMIFVIYELLCLAALVLSAVTFKFTGMISSVVRTLVLLFALAGDLFAHRYVTVFGGITDAVEALDQFQGIEDNGFVLIAVSVIGAILMFFPAVTSIVALKRGNIPTAAAEE